MTTHQTTDSTEQLRTELRNAISADLYNLYYYELPDNMAEAKEIVKRAANSAIKLIESHQAAAIAALLAPDREGCLILPRLSQLCYNCGNSTYRYDNLAKCFECGSAESIKGSKK